VSLSNRQVISLLNTYFVPVYISNEDYQEAGVAPPEEKAELRRIFQEGYAANLSVGTVHVYLLRPNGRLLDTMHTAPAANPQNLIPMLERCVQTLGTSAGTALVTPKPLSPPPAGPETLRLRVVSRWLDRQDGKLVLAGQDENDANWSALPSAEWILWGADQWKPLLPPESLRVGQAWTLTGKEVRSLLAHFYPPTESWEPRPERIQTFTLRATLLSREGNRCRARLEGQLRLKHPFYHTKDDANYVTAPFVGYLEFAADRSRIFSLSLVTEEATYGEEANRRPFGVTVSSAAR
jgi:hypothetical protein